MNTKCTFWCSCNKKVLLILISLQLGYGVCLKPSKQAIASSSKYATQIGMNILDNGGNAFDAAVAISAVLGVVEPYHSGIGGGGFWLFYKASEDNYQFIDSREVAPIKSHSNMYLDNNDKVVHKLSIDGPLAAGIPGIPASWEFIAKKYCNLPLSKLLEPAIELAKNGFEIDSDYQKATVFRLKTLQKYPAAAKIFLINNQVPILGSLIVQHDLANTLQAIAKHGGEYFYTGEISKRIIKQINIHGGIWVKNDLVNYKVQLRKPLIRLINNMKIITAPPPSAGGITIITILNILSEFNNNLLSRSNSIHITIEAMKRAYMDRYDYISDPDYHTVPTEYLVSIDNAKKHANKIRLDRASPSKIIPKKSIGIESHDASTSHFSIIDREGNRVSATLTINGPFGSGFVIPSTGILLNNEMDDFAIKPGTPNLYGLVGNIKNAISPGKRPVSSMSPTFIETPNAIAILGTPGGSRIPTMVLLAILDFMRGNKPKSWVSLPRFHHQYSPNEVQYEKNTFNNKIIVELKRKGHKMAQQSNTFGNMQAILWDISANTLYANSDPRRLGLSMIK